MKILSVVGARPQFIKAAAMSRVMRATRGLREVLVHTGQHYDRSMPAVFFRELQIPRPDRNLGIGSGTHGAQTGRMLEALERAISSEKSDWVLVYGDTNSTLAGALAAAKLKIPVARVEAGLRSDNRAMPEEINRVVADHASDLLFAPTRAAVANLLRKGIARRKIVRVGDIMYDAALYYGEKAERTSRVLPKLALAGREYVLATVHRAENTDDGRRLHAIFGALRRLAREMPLGVMSKIRVLHVPEMFGGNPPQHARAEREVGLESWCVSFRKSYFDYRCDEILWEDPGRIVTNEIRRWRLLRRAVRDYDEIHFNAGTPVLPKRVDREPHQNSQARGLASRLYNLYAAAVEFRDLAWLPQAGKAIFVTYQGDDARQGEFCRRHFKISPADEVEPGYYSTESDERKRREFALFDCYADGIFALNPDLLHVLLKRARFLPYASIDPREWRPAARSSVRTRPLVIHAPSHRGVKGTRYIMEAVARLKAEGVNFEFTLVEGLSNAQARALSETADLLVDQLLTGWYGAVAVEMMALGKPVVCYLREDDLKFIDSRMRADPRAHT